MKCLVCGKNYEAAECPRCHFPDIQLMGDREAALASLMPTIQTYRKNFLSKVKVELVIYHWKDQNGQIVADYWEPLLLGTANDLLMSEIWLDQKFARIADLEMLSVTVCITVADERREEQVAIPNLHEPELQQLGAYVDEDFNLVLMLRNDTHLPVKSVPVLLLLA